MTQPATIDELIVNLEGNPSSSDISTAVSVIRSLQARVHAAESVIGDTARFYREAAGRYLETHKT